MKAAQMTGCNVKCVTAGITPAALMPVRLLLMPARKSKIYIGYVINVIHK